MKLENIRYETFAHLVALGSTRAAAYIDAGFSMNSAPQGAERLSRNPAVAARIEELRAENESLMALKRDYYLKELFNRFMNNPPELATTAKYGEMLAKAMGWNEPERTCVTSQEINVVIGGGF